MCGTRLSTKQLGSASYTDKTSFLKSHQGSLNIKFSHIMPSCPVIKLFEANASKGAITSSLKRRVPAFMESLILAQDERWRRD